MGILLTHACAPQNLVVDAPWEERDDNSSCCDNDFVTIINGDSKHFRKIFISINGRQLCHELIISIIDCSYCNLNHLGFVSIRTILLINYPLK